MEGQSWRWWAGRANLPLLPPTQGYDGTSMKRSTRPGEAGGQQGSGVRGPFRLFQLRTALVWARVYPGLRVFWARRKAGLQPVVRPLLRPLKWCRTRHNAIWAVVREANAVRWLRLRGGVTVRATKNALETVSCRARAESRRVRGPGRRKPSKV